MIGNMPLNNELLPAYAELVASLQNEEPSAVLERLRRQIAEGALDLADVFVTLDGPGQVTGILRLGRIGKDEAFLTQWRGKGGRGTRRTIAGLLSEAKTRADELGVRAHQLPCRVQDPARPDGARGRVGHRVEDDD
jgi:hypothetical protein